jgi:elongation factor Ts
MAEISPADVAKLREATGAGMLQCKKALVEAGGDFQNAVDILRKQGAATAASKALKQASEGVIAHFIQPGGKLGVIMEVNCQTDFVARNQEFRDFCDQVAEAVAAEPGADLEARRQAMVARMGENIVIARHQRMEVTGNGAVAAYIHTGAKVGVLVEVGCDKQETTGTPEFKQVIKDITLQIAAAHPVAVTRDQVDPKVAEKEKEIAQEQFKNKPPQAIAKIVEGKLNSFFQTVCLVDQGFVKDPDKTVQAYVEETSKKLADPLVIRRFVRFQVGETPAP